DWVDRLDHRGSLDSRAVRAATRTASRLRGSLRRGHPEPATDEERDVALRRAVLAGFPDRVARRRTPTGEELVLSGGGSALLDRASVVRHAELVVVVDAEERRGRIWARAVSAIEPEWLLE